MNIRTRTISAGVLALTLSLAVTATSAVEPQSPISEEKIEKMHRFDPKTVFSETTDGGRGGRRKSQTRKTARRVVETGQIAEPAIETTPTPKVTASTRPSSAMNENFQASTPAVDRRARGWLLPILLVLITLVLIALILLVVRFKRQLREATGASSNQRESPIVWKRRDVTQ